MRFLDIIEKKKQHGELTQEELHFFIQGYVQGRIPDYQVSALMMAICLNGMKEQETVCLTQEMLNSGDKIDLSSIKGVICDKHSTGGVGDKTTLALAPMVAACGVKIAKMSGRGLGHTGGTLDKLESISGFSINRNEKEFIAQVNAIGLAIIGQSKTLVPADKKLYALRDVSGTIDSIPLIASSIMSKKLAAGTDCILLDVKYGEGAFMPTPKKAEELAQTMIHIGKHFHKDVSAMISNMKEPLGNAIGNAIEVKEAIATLEGKGPKDFSELCICAGSIMLQQAGIAKNEENARKRLWQVIHNGEALEKLCAMVKAQGGDVEEIYHPDRLPQAKQRVEIIAKEEGYIQQVHALTLGQLAMELGAGRMVKEDAIDPAVGIVLNKKSGAKVKKGEILASVYTNHPLSKDWIQRIYEAFTYSEKAVPSQPLIEKILS